MKIGEMTDSLFDREMQRILGDVQFWCIRLDQIGDFSLEPTPVSYVNGSGQQPFPLAIDIKEVWDYARGKGSCPRGINEIIQALCELLWSSVGENSYTIPNYWWDEPLGFMCQLAFARQAMDNGESLNAVQLAMLAGLSSVRIKQLCQSGDIPAGKVEQARNSQLEWAIPADVAREWLESRK
jgi:hypothetical protein